MPGTYSARFTRSSSQYAYITDAAQTNLDLSATWTFEAWVKRASALGTGARFVVCSKWLQAGDQRSYIPLYFNDDSTVETTKILLSPTGLSSGNESHALPWVPLVNKWYHIAVTWDGALSGDAAAKFYVNGVQYTSSSLASDIASLFDGTGEFQLGGSTSLGANFYFDGWLNDVRVWSDVRTPTEIADNFQALVDAGSANLEGNWLTTNDWLDRTANNNDLTAVNSPTFDADVGEIEDFLGTLVGPEGGSGLFWEELGGFNGRVFVGPGDQTAPVISGITPAAGGNLAADYATARITPVQFDVTDIDPGLAAIMVTIKYVGVTDTVVVYDGTNFLGAFVNSNTTKTVISDGFRFVLLPNGGWPRSIEQLFVYAVDAAGNVEALPS